MTEAARLTALEMRIAEQEKTIAELNDMVVEQWRKIDRLERRVAQLRDEVDSLDPTRSGQPEPPPPHY